MPWAINTKGIFVSKIAVDYMHPEQRAAYPEDFRVSENKRIFLAGYHRLVIDVRDNVVFGAENDLVPLGEIEIDSGAVWKDLPQFFSGKQVIELSCIQEHVAVNRPDYWVFNSKQLHAYRHDSS
jgi:hypothetical protein